MEINDDDVKRFQETIRENSVYDFSEYSVSSLKRRLTKITENYNHNISDLIDAVSGNQVVLEDIIKKITVTTTELFRDPNIWLKIISEIIPKFKESDSINIWHAGCSTGQEVYSMMILLDHYGQLEKSNIFASDINTDVLKIAQEGIYKLLFHEGYIENFKKVFPSNASDKDDPFGNYRKYFKIDKISDKIIMTDYLTHKPVFKKNDLVKDDNPFNVNFDLVFCRNVIIYFNHVLQSRVLKMFHRNMKDNSFLVLGKHESIIGTNSKLFRKYDLFYKKI